MGIKKPSDYFREESKDENLIGKPNLNSYSEAFNSFKENLSKFDKITDTIKIVDEIKTELQDFLKKEDLDNAMMSYVFLLEENINNLKNSVKSINTKTLTEIKSKVTDVTEVVNDFAEVELPKYKKNIIDAEVRSDKKFNQFKEEFSKLIEEVSTDIDTKQFEIESKTEENLNEVVKNLESHIESLYSGNEDLSKTIKTKVNEIKKLKKDVIENFKVNKSINKDLTEKISNLEIEIIRGENNIKEQNDDLSNKISNLENEIIRGENNLKEHNDNLSSIEKNIKQEFEKDNFVLSTKIKNLEEVYETLKEESKKLKEDSEKLKEESKINETLIEQIIPSTKTSDPLTPLDQNYVTLDQLQEHYRLFLNRIQTQLSTLGGGGETRLQYLDDIVGVASDLSQYDGKFLKVDTSQPAGKNFIFETVSGGGATGAGGTWATFDSNTGITTTKKVKISNDLEVTGVTTIGNVVVGGATTDLIVNGDARVTGILTIGTGSITLNPTEKKISGIDEIEIGSGTTAITIKKSETGEIKFTDESGDEKSVGIGTTVSINTSGIITATKFIGSGEDLTGLTATQIPNLNASKINAGTFDTARIPTLNQDTTGTAAGLSGTPDITIRNLVGVAATFTGVLTYEDVTNIDSIGLITARAGIDVLGGIAITNTGNASLILDAGTGSQAGDQVSFIDFKLDGALKGNIAINEEASNTPLELNSAGGTGSVKIFDAGAEKLTTTGTGVSVTGILTATSFSGDLTGTATSITVTANNSGNETVYPVFVDGATGSQGAETDTNLYYNPTSNELTVGSISANTLTASLNINANGNIIGDDATNISGINSVTAVKFFGDGSELTGISAGFSPDGQENLYAGTDAGAASDSDTCFNIGIGYEAHKALNSGDNNVAIGKRAGCSSTSGNRNIFLGHYSGSTSTTGSGNVFLGRYIGYGGALNNSAQSVVIGDMAGCKLSYVAHYNVFLGAYAGRCATSACRNTLLGYKSAINLTEGDFNVVIGSCIDIPIVDGNCQLLIGNESCRWVEGDSSYNVTLAGIATISSATGIVSATKFCGDGSALTGLAGFSPDGQENLYAGTSAGAASDADTCFNIALGKAAACELNAGDNNVILGCFAGSSNASGSHNVMIGQGAGKETTSGCNVFIGRYAGRCVTTGCRNVSIGSPSGGKSVNQGNSTGDQNVTIGDCSGINITSGDKNTFLGHYTGVCNTTGSCNTAVGTKAMGGQGYITGSYNVALGESALCGVCAGSNNIAIGCDAGKEMTSGCNNIFLGENAGNTNTSGTRNIAIGRDVELVVDGNDQLAIGCCGSRWITGDSSFNVTLAGIATISSATGIVSATKFCGDGSALTGISAGGFSPDGQENLYAGTSAGAASDADTCFNIGIGYEALNSLNSGDENIAIGKCAGYDLSSGGDNIFLGKCAGFNATTGSDNIAIGNVAMGYGTVTGARNIAIGCCAGQSITSGDRNIFIGDYAGNRTTGGSHNTILGSMAGCQIGKFGYTGEGNTLIGKGTGRSMGASANVKGHTFVGCYAGKCVTAGCYNIMFGVFAGSYAGNITGSNNIAIGRNVCLPSLTGSDQLVVGSGSTNWITGNCDFNVGIGTTNPNAAVTSGNTKKLSVGILSAYQLYGDGSGLTNLPAGTSDKIEEGDSKVEVTDSGTGQINVVIDGNHFARFTNVSGRKAIFGSNVAVQNNYGTNCGDIIIADGGRRLRFHRTGVGLADDSVIGTIDFAAQQSGTGGQTVSLIQSSLRGSVENKSDLIFSTSNGGSPTEKLRIMHTGNVGIGTTNPDAAVGAGNTAKLSVGILSAYQLYGDGSALTGISAGGFSQDDQGNLVAGTNAGAAKDADTCFNIMIGCNAGLALCGGYGHSIFMGCHAGKSVTTGGYNFLFGQRTGCNITTGQQNIMMGNGPGKTITTGSCNIFFGKSIAGAGTGEHDNNIVMGAEAAYRLDTGDDNIILGAQAGCDVSSGNRNIYMGKSAAANSTTGSDNIALGCCAMYSCAVTGNNNVFLGSYSGRKTESAGCNIAIGYKASEFMETGDFNVAIGAESGGSTGSGVSGHCNVAIGKNALQQLTGGTRNVALGFLAGGGGGPGSRNVVIGTCAGWCGVKSDDTIAIGYFAGCMAADPTNGCGIFIGRYAGRAAAEGKAIIIGCEAGRCAVDADNSIFIGSAAGKCACNAADGNLFIGQCAGRGSSTLADNTGDYNIAFGQNALVEFTSGSDNVVIGRNAGCTVTSGSCNVLIGYAATVSSATGNHQLAIGAGNTSWVTGNSDFDVTLAGIATISSATGIVSATKFCGDGSALTGISAGGLSADDDLNLFASNTCSGCNLDGSSGCHNLFLGSCAGKCVTSGNGNVYLGQDAGRYSNSGGRNVSIGYQAGCCACTNAYFNVNIGALAGAKLTTQCCGVNIGQCAGYSDFPGVSNIFIGSCAGWRGGCGNKNIAIGNAAGMNMKGTSKAVFIGDFAGRCIQGASNIAIGECALSGSSSADDNTAGYNIALGYKSGKNITTGEKNVILGTSAGHNMTTGNHNVLLGTSAGVNNSSGLRNIAIGCCVQLVADGDDQFAIGCGTSRWIEGDSSFNVTLAGIATISSATGIVSATKFCGDGSALTGLAGFSPDAQENLYAGTGAGAVSDANTCFNVGIGYSSLAGLTGTSGNPGNDNVAIGKYAGAKITDGCRNILIGLNAGCCVTSAKTTTAIGHQAGRDFRLGSYNSFFGSYAGMGACAGQQNTGIGNEALKNVGCAGNSNQNTGVGHKAGACNQNACYNTFVGACAGGGKVVCGNKNTAIGYGAGEYLTTGTGNFFGGYDAGGYCEVTGGCNIAIGHLTGRCLTSGNANVFMGDCTAMCGAITATGNVAIGCRALCFLTSANHNMAIGYGSGKCTTTCGYNVFFGYRAGNQSTGGQNVYVGRDAGLFASSGNYNIAFGNMALSGEEGSNTGGCNIAIGRNTGYEITSGNNNIMLGRCAGWTITSGSCNIMIGCKVDVPILTGDNQLVIGNGSNLWITGNSDFNVGIGTTNPNAAVGAGNTAKLSVGIVSAYQLYGDGSNLTGISGGSVGVSTSSNEIAQQIYVGTGITNFNFVGAGITASITDTTTGNVFIPSAVRKTTRFVATANQTTFTGLNYTVGYVDVFLNGIKLDGQDEFTATNGTSVVLTDGATVNDIVEIVAQEISANLTITGIGNVVEDTTPQLGGNLDVNGKDISGTGDVNLTGIVTATTFSGGVDLSGLLKEGVKVTAGKLSDNLNIDLTNGMTHLFTTEETTTSTPNIRFDGSTALNAKMSIGEAVTVVIIVTADATGYSAQLTIDESAVTEQWLDGSTPSAGGVDGYDVYTHNIIKTADATFLVLSNLVNFT